MTQSDGSPTSRHGILFGEQISSSDQTVPHTQPIIPDAMPVAPLTADEISWLFGQDATLAFDNELPQELVDLLSVHPPSTSTPAVVGTSESYSGSPSSRSLESAGPAPTVQNRDNFDGSAPLELDDSFGTLFHGASEGSVLPGAVGAKYAAVPQSNTGEISRKRIRSLPHSERDDILPIHPDEVARITLGLLKTWEHPIPVSAPSTSTGSGSGLVYDSPIVGPPSLKYVSANQPPPNIRKTPLQCIQPALPPSSHQSSHFQEAAISTKTRGKKRALDDENEHEDSFAQRRRVDQVDTMLQGIGLPRSLAVLIAPSRPMPSRTRLGNRGERAPHPLPARTPALPLDELSPSRPADVAPSGPLPCDAGLVGGSDPVPRPTPGPASTLLPDQSSEDWVPYLSKKTGSYGPRNPYVTRYRKKGPLQCFWASCGAMVKTTAMEAHIRSHHASVDNRCACNDSLGSLRSLERHVFCTHLRAVKWVCENPVCNGHGNEFYGWSTSHMCDPDVPPTNVPASN